MRTSCLINCCNYRRFVGEAVDSALAQKCEFDEVIVVDDGSTDGSLGWLQEQYGKDSRVQVVAKPNGGQYSALIEGFDHATGDLIFFLDADDTYHPAYAEHAVRAFEQDGPDFVIAGCRNVGQTKPRRKDRRFAARPPRDLGYSLIRVVLSEGFIGGPTSTLSMRREIAEQVLAYPRVDEWRIRADDVLVIGASLVGARKHYLAGQLVDYRVHGDNRYTGRQRCQDSVYQHALARNRLVTWHAERQGLDLGRLATQLHREFATIERPTRQELGEYLMNSWRSKMPFKARRRQVAGMLKHFFRERAKPPREQPVAEPTETSTIETSLPVQRRQAG